ncbi:MAG: hypothetical protein JXR88_09060 [Clostridia bacterium]|nr:hypothetical protein [Clostridia bacterium]
MSTLNESLNQASEALVAVERAKRKLAVCNQEYDQLVIQQKAAYEKLKKENADVDKIIGVTFTSFVATLLGNREEKIEKEEMEAILAKEAYDAIQYEVDEKQSEIQGLKGIIENEEDIRNQYSSFLKEKMAIIKGSNDELSHSIETLENKKQSALGEIKEIREALMAANAVHHSAKSALDSLNKAKNWGTYDMLGGGIIATMAKRSHMQEGQNHINKLNYDLKNFGKELKDVDDYTTSSIEIGSYFQIGDWLFDGLFVDMMVQSKIHNALEQVTQVRTQIVEFQNRLMLMEEQKKSEVLDVENKIEELILQQE